MLRDEKRELVDSIFKGNDKKILIWGYGVTGKAFLTFCHEYLDKSNQYVVVDRKFEGVQTIENVLYVNEDLLCVYLSDVDFVLPSPGIVLDGDAYYYRKIITEFDLFFYLNEKMGYETVVVTGSIGKTSVVTMLGFYLKKFYDVVVVAGNIGISLLACLDFSQNVKKVMVIEASSVQLEHSMLVCPHYFIITNLYENHLNMHKDFYSYGVAKLLPVLLHQTIKKIIYHSSVDLFIQEHNIIIPKFYNKKIIIFSEDNNNFFVGIVKRDGSYWYDGCDFLSDNEVPQYSYRSNWFLVSLLRFLMVRRSIHFQVEGLPELPHFRLEKIFDRDGVVVYNDSKSTIIESTYAAVYSISLRHPGCKIWCIIGGLSKGVDRRAGIEHIATLVDKMYCFGGEVETFFGNLEKRGSLEEIVFEIRQLIMNNKDQQIIIVFSPGGSSFDLYDSYIHRGHCFNDLVMRFFE